MSRQPQVLIVDDSLTVRMDLAEVFEGADFEVHPCATAQEARDRLAAGPVDCIVLDVRLPDGDGVEFLAELRSSAHSASTPVLMLSSEAEVKDRIRGLKTGADEYVGKPYDAGYIVAKARELVASRQEAVEASPGNLVLVIDDSPSVRGYVTEALEDAGFRVIVAETGEEGLRMAAQYRPAALVVDGILPGIDGATVIRRIRLDAALRGTPCILFTGTLEDEAELGSLEAGADAFVRKGELEVLLARVTSAVRKSADRPQTKKTTSLMGPKKILAVDDSPTYLNAVSGSLVGEGYDVVQAYSGEEAIELLQVQSVDCILLDLHMPGMGGQATCMRIKTMPGLREIPLIILTGSEDRAAMIEGLGAGADDFISKSAEFEVLRARVRAQLRRKQFEDEKRQLHADLLEKELEAAQARAARELAEARAVLIQELEIKNKELETFSYSVSHDLRAPLRAIDGFCSLLLREYAEKLDDKGRHYLDRVRVGSERMSLLIEHLLKLSRITRTPLSLTRVDLSEVAESVLSDLRASEPDRQVEVTIRQGLCVQADPNLLRVVLQNLLANAFKFTAGKDPARVEIGELRPGTFFVRDNGAGFAMNYADKLFVPFQRLHSDKEFEGTGVGLATVDRVIARHHGRIWGEGAPGEGATFYFTLGEEASPN